MAENKVYLSVQSAVVESSTDATCVGVSGLTRPVSSGGPRAVGAGVTDRQEDSLPTAGGVAPVVGF